MSDKSIKSLEVGSIHDTIELREVIESDLPIFFEYQSDPDAIYMAAFTAKDPTDKAAFDDHWQRILADKSIIIRTILYRGDVAGSVLSFVQDGKREVGYWTGKEYWGKGITTVALARYLAQVQIRPLYARTAKDNIASIRVLEKCGFKIISEDSGYANARGEETTEFILKLWD